MEEKGLRKSMLISSVIISDQRIRCKADKQMKIFNNENINTEKKEKSKLFGCPQSFTKQVNSMVAKEIQNKREIKCCNFIIYHCKK